jgi:ribulose-5-phosphate 4-epimerase/fuculose-1-phosphate aldolase
MRIANHAAREADAELAVAIFKPLALIIVKPGFAPTAGVECDRWGRAPLASIKPAMSSFDTLIQDLVIANRILAKEDVVDAYGHVSVRHPDNPRHFLIARSIAPELVTPEDIVELDLDGQPAHDEKRTLYLERFIHAAIFEARPDVMAVVHAHAEDTLPFGIANATALRPVIHSGSFIGTEVPVWDIAENFGDTNLLVSNMEQGRDLAKCLGASNVALMRGHGFASAGRTLIEVVRMSVYLPRNARTLMRAKQLGGAIKYLSQGEIDARNRGYSPYSTETWRAWEYWANKAGCGHMLTRPDDERTRALRS